MLWHVVWRVPCVLPCHDWALAITVLLVVQVPIMLRSSYCSLDSMSEKEITDVGECPYDQVLAGRMSVCQALPCSLARNGMKEPARIGQLRYKGWSHAAS